MLALLVLGAGRDLWRAHAPGPRTERARAAADARPPAAAEGAAADSALLPAPTAGAPPAPAAALDLNRATEVELDRLPGVGPVLAGRIVEHRRRHGPFRRIEELRAVRGVGPRLLARLRPLVRVEVFPSVPGRGPSRARRTPAKRPPGGPRPVQFPLQPNLSSGR